MTKFIVALITIIAGVSMILLLTHPGGITVDPPKMDIPKVQIVSQP